MSQHNNQNEIPVAYPPPGTAACVAATPPAGYPTGDGQQLPQQKGVPVKTKSKGDGFWKGCFAALCCCCVLDACC